MRGGISVISHRYARANNPYLKPEDYDETQPFSYICYLDANNLYGWAISQYLRCNGFRFMSEDEIEKVDWANVPYESETCRNASLNTQANYMNCITIFFWHLNT